ncbi:Integral inner nuclear membrane protein ima1 [Madurella mycetomatis]|uniref:Integral inner nuclear membrane protein ima1 n=1 Tax=Madurella mycetomatis TaxID=100816 RepID=A0A175WEQ1_9PEZI|nr:Integral inner nuclear membrane protein ima1 [Madurella mycetomatis]
MRRLHRNRYLTCFYCGRKTSTVYDGRTRHFECPSCDADNYLDENGDVADPPVATDQEATPIRPYAVPRATSPPSSPSNGLVFCEKCLHNQHLLRASLAQYLPDPEDPDYAERERSFHRFRANQERLYPQICADCEPKVRQRLEQAAYTAKTDALRHMIDRSASARKSVGRRGWLDLVGLVGQGMWISGFVVQLAWHAAVLYTLLSRYLMWTEADSGSFAFKMQRTCGPLVSRFLSQEWLLQWSTVCGILGIWWNPRFAQTSRGFSKPVRGVFKWYIYQLMTITTRICLWQGVFNRTTAGPPLLKEQLASHFFAAFISFLIFTIAPRSVRIDTAPLFRPSTQPLRLHNPPAQATSSRDRDDRPDDTKAMFELLDEVLRSPTSPEPPSPPLDASPTLPRKSPSLPMGHAHTLAAQTFTHSLQQIDSLHLSHQQQTHRAHTAGADEMDWSPTPATSLPATTTTSPIGFGAGLGAKSKYRAFNTIGQRSSQPFGSAPVEPHKGAFWYKVPPAPTTPAQRLFNPLNRPGTLRSSPTAAAAGQKQEIKFRGSEGTTLVREGYGGEDGDRAGQGARVNFAEPSFFAEQVVRRGRGSDDPRDGLTGLFGQGFTLDSGSAGSEREGGGWLSRLVGGGGGDNEKKTR